MLPANKSKVLIFGAGALGLWLGGLLSQKGHSVHIVSRFDICDAVKSAGLTVKIGERQEVWKNLTPWRALEVIPAAERKFDWVFITVRTHDLVRACDELTGFLSTETRVVAAQDGTGYEKMLAQRLGEGRLYFASTTNCIAILEPGVVALSPVQGGITFCPYLRTSPVGDLINLFSNLGINLQSHDDFRSVKWSKLLLDLLVNASSAIPDIASEEILADMDFFVQDRQTYKEGLAVMKAMDLHQIDLPGYPVSSFKLLASGLPGWIVYQLMRKQLAGTQMKRWSPLRSGLEKGRKVSQVEYINGAVVKQGKKWKVPTPKNEFLFETLSAIATGRMPWSTYKKKANIFLMDYQAA